MGKGWMKVLAAVLVVCVLLTGCSAIGDYFSMLANVLLGQGLYSFEEMTYTRPDMEQFDKVLEESCELARTETNLDALLEGIYAFYAVYDSFYTAQSLAMIYYCKDMTDTAWEAEHQFCTEHAALVAAGLDQLYRALAQSPLREQLETAAYFGADYFDSYEGESLFDEYFLTLLDQEAQLQNAYYAIYADAGEMDYRSEEFDTLYGGQMKQLLIDLVLLRQQIGAYAGFDNYVDFAYEFYYARDYQPAQAEMYLEQIRVELVPLYQQLAENKPDILLYETTQQQTYAYVEQMTQDMGGIFRDAFQVMTQCNLYDIAYGENKYNASFETYISDYYLPYVFLNPSMTEYDKLTFAHEFGHFCNDYASYGSVVGVDVAEIFSQGLEYLSLCYGEKNDNLRKLKMLDCLCVYVEQAAYATFEQQLYGLPAETLTVDTMDALYADICGSYGINTTFSYTLITHFYTNPMYVISYVVSNDAALQLYQLEQAERGSGLDCLERNLETRQPYFLAFLKEAGLKSPFDEGRIQQVKETLQDVLQS